MLRHAPSVEKMKTWIFGGTETTRCRGTRRRKVTSWLTRKLPG